ncbi:hypothetical protein ULF88_24620 [Halopseudomonas pachastrellae]|nr:hypothetical protein [Halopseudomonas pachastrellae]
MLQLGHDIRAEVLQKTGIPVGIGIAPTKTLAKLANAAAKRWQRQTGGVVDIREPHRRDRLLQVMAVVRSGESVADCRRIWRIWASRQRGISPKLIPVCCASASAW